MASIGVPLHAVSTKSDRMPFIWNYVPFLKTIKYKFLGENNILRDCSTL